MKLKVVDYALTGGKELGIEVTAELLQKYVPNSFDFDDLWEDDINYLLEDFMRELNLDCRYGDDRSVLALAVVMECMNASSDYKEFEEHLSNNTPFNEHMNGFIMFILSGLEAKEFLRDTKYPELLTEKGKVLLWLLRRFAFYCDHI